MEVPLSVDTLPLVVTLPNAEKALVDRDKLRGYLLDSAHADGGGKADFFTGQGFSREEWEVLARTLREIAVSGAVVESVASKHGRKYVVDGVVRTPNGKAPTIRTVWIVDAGSDLPRLVTAYPQVPRGKA